jgi:hypothetical protein
VARAKERVKLSEPDVRTPEQKKAAREASRPDADRNSMNQPRATTAPFRSSKGPSTGSTAKTDG